jgi:hypothetical protein
MPRVADRFAAEPSIVFFNGMATLGVAILGIAILGTAILQRRAATTVVHQR